MYVYVVGHLKRLFLMFLKCVLNYRCHFVFVAHCVSIKKLLITVVIVISTANCVEGDIILSVHASD